jgi:glycosyltransferase involved in cell wall biosynthesis
MSKPRVITIGYGRHFFSVGNVERERMESCAEETLSTHMIVFTLASDNLEVEQLSSGLVLHPTNSRSKLFMVFDAVRIASELIKKSGSECIVTTQDPFAAGVVGYVLKKKFDIWWVAQEHGDVFGSTHWRSEHWTNWCWFGVGVQLLRRADVVRVVSKRVRNNMIALGVVESKLTLLPVSIDVSQFKKKTTYRTDPSQPFHFLTVARLVKQKNFSLLLEAFHTAWEINPLIRLTIVGAGPELQNINQSISALFPTEHAPVTMQGWSNDVPNLLRECDAYVLSSNYEGWARVLIEALVTAVPVVTTDVGCATEVIKNEVHGLVVPVDSTHALTEALVQMSTDQDEYQSYIDNLQVVHTATIPGAQVDSYGRRWVETLTKSSD